MATSFSHGAATLSNISLIYFKKEKVKLDETHTIDLYREIKRENVKRRSLKGDEIDALIDLLDSIEQQYGSSEGLMVLAETRVGKMKVRAAISTTRSKQHLLFPDIAKVKRVSIAAREEGSANKSYREKTVWEPSTTYYAYDGIIEGLDSEEILVIDTEMGRRLITIDDLNPERVRRREKRTRRKKAKRKS